MPALLGLEIFGDPVLVSEACFLEVEATPTSPGLFPESCVLKQLLVALFPSVSVAFNKIH